MEDGNIRKKSYNTDDMYSPGPRIWAASAERTLTGQSVPPPVSTKGGRQTISWTDFTQNTSFHGVRYIFEKSDQRFRRYIWLLVVVTAMAVFVIQVGIRTGKYLEYKTTLDVGVFYKDHLEFPAVTICNQNRYRSTAAAEKGLYYVIDEIFKETKICQVLWESFADNISGIDYGELVRQTGHQKHGLIDSCTWNGVDCDIEEDFTSVLTDLGICYTFNTQRNTSTVSTPRAGAGSGLNLVINVEQYEYMRGPQNDAGIKILLHPPRETPIMQEQGFAAAPGTHTLVAMKRYEVSTLPPPYGSCHPTSRPVSECNAQCRARQVFNMCGCQTEYMEPFSSGNTTMCDFKTSLLCVRQALADMMKSEWECDCDPPCNQTRYEPQLSYAQLSKFNIDRMILDNPDKQKVLQENYMKARETSQRYRQEIKVKDTTDMTRLVNITARLKYILQNILVQTTDPLNTSRHFTLPTILVKEPIFMDLELLKLKSYTLELLASSWVADTKTRILYNLEFINDTFLEWKDGVHTFQQFLQNCSQEAFKAKRNDSSDSSGDVNLAWTNGTNLTYVSGTCTENLQDKIDLMKTSLSYAYFARVDFKELEDGYRNLLISIFQNSTESADAYDDHTACLLVLRSELIKETYPDLYSELETFTKVDGLQEATSSINKIVDTLEALHESTPNLTRCYWVYSLSWNVTEEFYKNGDNAMNVNGRFIESFNTMSGTVVSMAEDIESLRKTILDMIMSYMNGNVTKMELARYILSSKDIQELSRHESSADIIIKSLQERLTNYMNSVASIYLSMAESPMYIISVEEVQELELFKLSYNTNRTDFQYLIDGLHENMTNVQGLLQLVLSQYQQSFQQLLGVLPSAFMELSDHLSMLRHDLQVYTESTTLNANFFMENFLQLDVFYKDMSYEVVTQQEAFGLLSLLGEVGGFLGLLLGASLITVCELLDYILLHVTARCTVGCRDRDPNMI